MSESDVLVDKKPFDLIEAGQMGGIDGLVSEEFSFRTDSRCSRIALSGIPSSFFSWDPRSSRFALSGCEVSDELLLDLRLALGSSEDDASSTDSF